MLRMSILLSILAVLLCGCGGKDAPTESEPAAMSAPAPVVAESPVEAFSEPEPALAPEPLPDAVPEGMNVLYEKPAEIVTAVSAHIAKFSANPELEGIDAPMKTTYHFIKALQLNDQNAALGLLTHEAYSERVRTGVSLTPAFPDGVDIAFGAVEYLTDPADGQTVVGARVGTTWKMADPTVEGSAYEENIAWVLRKDGEEWLVAGAIAVLDPRVEPILLDFEDVEGTQTRFAEIEAKIEEALNGDRNEVEMEPPATLP